MDEDQSFLNPISTSRSDPQPAELRPRPLLFQALPVPAAGAGAHGARRCIQQAAAARAVAQVCGDREGAIDVGYIEEC